MIFNLPFTYPWLIKKNTPKNEVKTILELGCGQGAFGDMVNEDNNFEITGIDIFDPYIKICQKKGKYKEVVKGDLTKKLNFKAKSFDAVVCLQTIEHMDKKNGLSLLREMERIAKKLVIISTPNGECSQEEYDNNKHQRHLSIWAPGDLRKLGFKVFGTGLKWVYGAHSHAKSKMEIIKLPLYFLSFMINPLAYQFSDIGCQLVAIKKIIK